AIETELLHRKLHPGRPEAQHRQTPPELSHESRQSCAHPIATAAVDRQSVHCSAAHGSRWRTAVEAWVALPAKVVDAFLRPRENRHRTPEALGQRVDNHDVRTCYSMPTQAPAAPQPIRHLCAGRVTEHAEGLRVVDEEQAVVPAHRPEKIPQG